MLASLQRGLMDQNAFARDARHAEQPLRDVDAQRATGICGESPDANEACISACVTSCRGRVGDAGCVCAAADGVCTSAEGANSIQARGAARWAAVILGLRG